MELKTDFCWKSFMFGASPSHNSPPFHPLTGTNTAAGNTDINVNIMHINFHENSRGSFYRLASVMNNLSGLRCVSPYESRARFKVNQL